LISETVRQTVKVLHTADGLLDNNSRFGLLAIFFSLLVGQLRSGIPLRLSRLFVGENNMR